jgi:cell division septation protein DedD
MVKSRELAHHVQDDAFHEIQLNGKQLVFLFMAATVVSVVIFLCGVLVGRGVRAERAAAAGDTTALNAAETTPQQLQEAAPPPPAGSDPTAATPPPAVDDLTYFNRLEKPNQPAEVLKPAPGKPVAAPAPQVPHATPAPAAKQPPSPAVAQATPTAKEQEPSSAARATPVPVAKEPAPAPPAKEPASSTAEPGGQGYALQIAALRDRDEADAIAKRLESKGYAAYVLAPASGTPPVFRVRVGKFKTRHDAETVSAKLQKEEQFNPWITR